ncbi:PIG-L family deacetylase [Chloroflexota bacterium]|nr:PIG-L family deacetylase [Chloroflexota bacterium]
MMLNDQWIFISPHLDDVALSCGGLVWRLAKEGQQVSIWTLLAGDPPDEDYSEFARANHQRWGISGGEAIAMRRKEDQAACDRLGAAFRHFDLLDAIYRRDSRTGEAVVNNNDELFGKQPEPEMVSLMTELLSREAPAEAQLVLPLGLGGHIDHRLAATASESFQRTAAFYLDFPYILNNFETPILKSGELQKIPAQLSEEALTAWQDAVLCYVSQVGDFWTDEAETRLALRNYLAGGGGRLWIRI